MPETRPHNDQLDPCLIVIFGASGDLTKRKLIPSLYHLYREGLMPPRFGVVGISRSKLSDDDFRQRLHNFAQEMGKPYDDDVWADFAPLVHYHAADSTQLDDFDGMKERIANIQEAHGLGSNVLYYLSVAPSLYDPTINNLGAAEMITEGKRWCSINRDTRPWQRVIVEKPFGHDRDSAAHLNRVLGRVFEDEEVFRIDHYLGKETVQNLMAFRFANSIFEPIWNRTYIDHVQVTAAETVGVEGRGGYYDSPDGGAMRDMIQSHLLQLMAVVAMEPPATMTDRDIRTETTKVLTACRQWTRDDAPNVAVRGQYIADPRDPQRKGYRQEEGVAHDSTTDTYAALKVMVDNWRWKDVPFYLRSGKRLAKKSTEIVIYFRPAAHGLFEGRNEAAVNEQTPANQIVINVQPDEGIRLRFQGKVPGIGMKLKPVLMHFDYAEQFEAEPPEAYATLLLDALKGDQTNFKQRLEIEHAWRIVQPILDYWAQSGDEGLDFYESGTWGPRASDRMLETQGRHWRLT